MSLFRKLGFVGCVLLIANEIRGAAVVFAFLQTLGFFR